MLQNNDTPVVIFLATKTIQMAFELAKEKGFTKIYSRARVNNIASVNIHKKCGFKIVDKNLSKAGHKAYDYVCIL